MQRPTSHFRAAWITTMALALAACGGADTTTTTKAASAPSASDSAKTPDAPDATLTAQSLLLAEKRAQEADPSIPIENVPAGKIAAKQAYALGDVARKAVALRIPVYRFYNSQTGAHFYTTSEAEKASILATLPQFHLDGVAFHGASTFSPGLSPVYRFYNTQTGVHFYTISETEKNSILATLPQYQLDGPAYHASQVAGAGLTPLFRFYVPSRGFHFYTASEAEKNSIVATLSSVYSYEGPAYYVLASEWKNEKVPHTGVTNQQCYAPSLNTPVDCSQVNVTTLNSQQDGHRTAVNPMSYSAYGAYPTTACIKDNVTGLIWEAKTTDGGLHDKDKVYTKLNNGLATDVYPFIAAVNASNLCGFSDWRLPTRDELLGLVDYSSQVAPRAQLANTGIDKHWTSTLAVGYTQSSYYVDFSYGDSAVYDHSYSHRARLVHGTVQTGPRSIVSTVAYGSDAANNTVSDTRSGLQWRRCEEGRTWNGSTCTGTVTSFGTHESALAHAQSKAGWRLPNVKELASLTDLTRTPASLDTTVFPGDQTNYHWSSTPEMLATSPGYAWAVLFNGGYVTRGTRSGSPFAVRLVRDIR
ncbi:DUF1566 domain-containing protein [Hydrogenophaga sp. RWCD_12]|uniref:DUF1566 domain-containing protein n=1 Tax=Hydrogenophaga sp. RWCD_12 TaxID=3391190 RepID=UPI00398516AB